MTGIQMTHLAGGAEIAIRNLAKATDTGVYRPISQLFRNLHARGIAQPCRGL